MDAFITYVTTCRGRLAHLKQSLPRLAAQPRARCVVVDYGCPENAGDWVEANFPQVKVVRSGPREHFEAARARNLGAREASTEWLGFLDADALAAPEFTEAIAAIAQPGHYYFPEGRHGSLLGQCIVNRADFERAGGYDEVLQGWGMEDQDLLARLDIAQVKPVGFASGLVEVMDHSAESRVAHHRIKNRRLSSTINLVYCRAKWDMLLLQVPPKDVAEREALYRRVSELVAQGMQHPGKFLRLTVPYYATDHWSGTRLRSGIVLEIQVPTFEDE